MNKKVTYFDIDASNGTSYWSPEEMPLNRLISGIDSMLNGKRNLKKLTGDEVIELHNLMVKWSSGSSDYSHRSEEEISLMRVTNSMMSGKRNWDKLEKEELIQLYNLMVKCVIPFTLSGGKWAGFCEESEESS